MEKLTHNMITTISTGISEEIIKDEALQFVKACFQCGTCSGSCPSGRRTAIRTRQVIRRALLGLEEVLSSDDIWLCSTCYTCYERCPRSLPVTNIIIKLRNLASQRGYMKPPHIQVTHVLSKTGHGVPLGVLSADPGNNWSQMRERYGLPSIPPTTHSHPEAVKECQTLMHSTGFDSLIGLVIEETKPEVPKTPPLSKTSKQEKKAVKKAVKVPATKPATKTKKKTLKKTAKKPAKKSVKKAAKKSVKKAAKKSVKKAAKKPAKKSVKKAAKKPAKISPKKTSSNKKKSRGKSQSKKE